MGIKGIYKEIGDGQRKSLAKLAVEHLERTGRPLRLAIDISIWQFQVQAAKGGSNPAIRTLFYRLTRLLGHSIQPLFVFDGPNKPVFKRGKRSKGNGDSASNAMMKRLIRLFGFTVHDAPGEAEAECALLQQKGVVDAVLSEDVDTIMFGCGKTMRHWSAESKNGQTPTHVTVYDAEALRKGDRGLDREGMVLVALMSGGDYIPEGIPNCGVKLACEAARAGFGASLCRIKKSDQAAIDAWKDDLLHELRTNEQGFFRTKHKALNIPDEFPSMEVLRYYTHPVVSQQSTVDRLSQEFPSKSPVNIVGLREFVRDTFDWTYRIGAVKLVRVLAPSLLVQSLLNVSTVETGTAQDEEAEKRKEGTLVQGLSNRRAHFSTDAMPELRVSYVPIDMVPLDLDSEPIEEEASFGRDGLALNSDDEFVDEAAEVGDGNQAKKSKAKPFDPLIPNPIWVPETIVQLGVPLTFESWQESLRQKELAKQAAAAAPPKRGRKRAVKKPDMLAGALDKWVKVTKNAPNASVKGGGGQAAPRARSPLADLLTTPKMFVPPPQRLMSSSPARGDDHLPALSQSKPTTRPPRARPAAALKKASSFSSNSQTNPWTLAGSQVSARVTKTAGSSGTSKPATTGRAAAPIGGSSQPSQQQEPIVISSSPVVARLSPPPPTRVMSGREASPEEQVDDDDLPSFACLVGLPQPSPSAPDNSTSPKAYRKPSPVAVLPAKRTTRTSLSARPAAPRQESLLSGLKQASIKSYGVVGRPPATSTARKPCGTTHSDPIPLSDDEGMSAPSPRPLRSKRDFGRAETFAYGERRQSPPAEAPSDQPAAGNYDDPGWPFDDNFGEEVPTSGSSGTREMEEQFKAKKHLYIWHDDGTFEQIPVTPGEKYERQSRDPRAVRVSDVATIYDLTNE